MSPAALDAEHRNRIDGPLVDAGNGAQWLPVRRKR
jgi:hypothetical protein